MKIAGVLFWILSVLAALFWQPAFTAITTISITSMLMLIVLGLAAILDAVNRSRPSVPAPSRSSVGMFSDNRPSESRNEDESEMVKMYYGVRPPQDIGAKPTGDNPGAGNA